MKIFTTKSKKRNLFFLHIAVLVFWLAVWEIIYLVVGQEILIASPAQVFSRLMSLVAQKNFWMVSFASLGRILAGFLLAFVFGILLAILTSRFSLMRLLFQPIFQIIKAVPVASFIILALIWIRSGNVPIFISFLMVLPMVWSNISQGISSVDPQLLEVAKLFRFSTGKKIRQVYLPSLFPYLYSAFTTGIGFAWKSGVAAEVIGNTQLSIGRKIYESKIYLETADLFAWTIVVILLSLILEKLLLRLIRQLSKKLPFAVCERKSLYSPTQEKGGEI